MLWFANYSLTLHKSKHNKVHTKQEYLAAFERLLDVQERLRKECPWDRKQTFQSLRTNTIEETYELCDALMRDDHKNISKELGDVMEHVLFYAILGKETGDFDIADVCNQQADKLMFRHDFIDWTGWHVENPELTLNPKGQVVYQDELLENSSDSECSNPSAANKPKTAEQVSSTWEQRKQRERDGNKTVLSGVPASLPSLIKAYRIQDKARNVGFDWDKKEDVWAKVREEMDELEAELRQENKQRSMEELGDFLFSVINAARLYHLNPDDALELTNHKFTRRFGYVEKKAKEQGHELKDMSLAEMDDLWNEAKKEEK